MSKNRRTRAELLSAARETVAKQVILTQLDSLHTQLQEAITSYGAARQQADADARKRFKVVYDALKALAYYCDGYGIDCPELQNAYAALVTYEVKQDENS